MPLSQATWATTAVANANITDEIDDRRSAGKDDRRGKLRIKTYKGAKIIWPNSAPVRCVVRNLSETGAKLEVHGLVLQNSFELVFDLDQSRRSCRVLWRKEPWIGVKFR
jgi:hypothetical protein